nr:MAG TPA: hypothetical protein [Caudoviricetes sp.]
MKSLHTYINEARKSKSLNPSKFLISSSLYTIEEDPEDTGNGVCKLFVNLDDLKKDSEVLDIAIDIEELSKQYKTKYKTNLKHLIIDNKKSTHLLFYSNSGKVIKDLILETNRGDFIITTDQKFSNCVFLGNDGKVFLLDENINTLIKNPPIKYMDDIYSRYKWFTPKDSSAVSNIFKNCEIQGVKFLEIGKKGDRLFKDIHKMFNDGGLNLEKQRSGQRYVVSISNYFTYMENDPVDGRVVKHY